MLRWALGICGAGLLLGESGASAAEVGTAAPPATIPKRPEARWATDPGTAALRQRLVQAGRRYTAAGEADTTEDSVKRILLPDTKENVVARRKVLDEHRQAQAEYDAMVRDFGILLRRELEAQNYESSRIETLMENYAQTRAWSQVMSERRPPGPAWPDEKRYFTLATALLELHEINAEAWRTDQSGRRVYVDPLVQGRFRELTVEILAYFKDVEKAMEAFDKAADTARKRLAEKKAAEQKASPK